MPGPLLAQISFGDLCTGARFLWRLPAFLRHPIGRDEAQTILRHRQDRREADFLALLRRAVYENMASPYRPLLALVGCEDGDMEKLATQDGVEGALRRLLSEGVYLTVDEFKGRRPVVRGSMTMVVEPGRFRNPLSTFHVTVQTSGSRSPGTPVPIDLAFIRDCAVDTGLALDARGGSTWLNAQWQVPGGAVIARLLEFSSCGATPVRWFSHVDPAAPGLHPGYRWSGRVMWAGSRVAGVPLPSPEYSPFDDPVPIMKWMEEVLRMGQTPHVFTFPSSAVRLCQVAGDAGIDLREAQFTVVGEPLTDTRLAVIRQSGADAVPRYAITECSTVGHGCLAPESADEVHLLHDLHAVIQPGSEVQVQGIPSTGLFLSSIRHTAPFVLLNVSMGDRATVNRRVCGCPMERLGWATHLHTIRSYEKLTAGGMTYLDTDVIHILEEVMPTRFGGSSSDYQLVEEEGNDGKPHLRLLVHPAVGPLDEDRVVEAFLAAISPGSGVERVMGLLWRDAGFLQVERRPPQATPGGKILHLHLERRLPSAALRRPSGAEG